MNLSKNHQLIFVNVKNKIKNEFTLQSRYYNFICLNLNNNGR